MVRFFFYVTPITHFYKQLLNSKVFQTWVQFFVVVCSRCLWRAKISVHVSPGSQVTWVCVTLIYKNSCLESRKMAQTEVKSSHCSCKGPQSVSSSQLSQLTTTCNSRSRGIQHLCGHLYSDTHAHTQTHKHMHN